MKLITLILSLVSLVTPVPSQEPLPAQEGFWLYQEVTDNYTNEKTYVAINVSGRPSSFSGIGLRVQCTGQEGILVGLFHTPSQFPIKLGVQVNVTLGFDEDVPRNFTTRKLGDDLLAFLSTDASSIFEMLFSHTRLLVWIHASDEMEDDIDHEFFLGGPAAKQYMFEHCDLIRAGS